MSSFIEIRGGRVAEVCRKALDQWKREYERKGYSSPQRETEKERVKRLLALTKLLETTDHKIYFSAEDFHLLEPFW